VGSLRDPEELRDRLEAFLKRAHGAPEVRVENLRLLTGGASRQTWAFDATIRVSDGPPRTHALVLRGDLHQGASFMERETEYRVLEAAREAGVPVPPLHLMGDDSLGTPFFLMEHVAGETIPRRLLREERYAPARRAMAEELGAILARIHDVSVRRPAFPTLPGATCTASSPAEEELARYEDIYRAAAPDPHPAFELAFRWLRDRLGTLERAAAAPRTLVHGDFRLGNLMLGPEGVRAVLDWELAHIGDPLEDLGWLCVRSWRFGNDDRPAAGVTTREQLWAAYEAAGGRRVAPERALFWEAFGNLRWGIMCILQARPYLEGQSRSLELASIGRRVAETEWELLRFIEDT
jgi:aminoglycoside phosphotransferase (APT) family kinase protein